MPIIAPRHSSEPKFVTAAATVVDSLRLLQLVAYLQSDLYSRASAVAGFIPAADIAVFTTLSGQETLHASTLSALITAPGRNGVPVTRPAFDFTGKGAVPGFAFAPAQYETFRMLA